MADWQGKSLLVTGGASGIGEACVRQAVAAGARVLICDLDTERGEALVQELTSSESGSDGNCHFQRCDVTNEADIAAAVAACVEHFGSLDAAANCAGIACDPATIEDTELSVWQRVIDVNLTSVFLSVKHQLKQMKAQGEKGRGAIVNVASGAGYVAAPYMVAYTASKHGVLGITKNAVQETRGTDIRINSVLPGSTRTPMMERTIGGSEDMEKAILASLNGGRMGTADEQAAAILWLLSDEASYVNGDSLVVDGGTITR